VHVGTLSVRGMPPWAHASTLKPVLRALLLALAAWSSASVAAYAVLRRAVRGRGGAIVLGGAGPLATLGLVRLLERADAGAAVFLVVPVAAALSAAAVALALPRLARLGESFAWSLRGLDRAASTERERL
jgi:hypothetical protein